MKEEFFSCMLIGNGSLMIPCGEYLIEKNCEIKAVITSNEEIMEWCEEHKIHTLREDNMNEIEKISFDYLFSIVYLDVLPVSMIRLPKKMAINYHDALLPFYAGIHATSWAIMNGEKLHGITWHVMEEKLDTGNILVQKEVEIERGETAVSLNIKCFQAALEAFYELTDCLLESNTALIPQDLTKRSYYGKWRKPRYAAFIDWNNNTEDILNFVHALDFGTYDNTLAVPRIRYRNHNYIVEEVEEYEVASPPKPALARMYNDGLIVGTKNGFLRIRKLIDLVGKQMNMVSMFQNEQEEFSLMIESETVSDLQATIERVCKKEPYWVSKYKAYNMDKSIWKKALGKVPCQKKPEEKRQMKQKTSNVEELIVSIAVELIKCGMTRYQHIGYCDTLYQGNGICKENVLFLINLEEPDELLDNIKAEINDVKQNISFTEDIFYRYPEIHQKYIVPFITVYLNVSNVDLYSSEVNFIFDSNTNEVEYSCCDKYLEEFAVQVMNRLSNKEHYNMGTVETKKTKEFKSVYQLINEQIVKQKDKIALISETDKITYSQLKDRIEDRAAVFYQNGIRKNMNVGVLLPRTHEVLISFLALQKLGAVYIPMDETYPAERLDFMAEDGQITYLVTDSRMSSQLTKGSFKVLHIDREKEIQGFKPEEVEIDPYDPVYILYTSGSTGKPKGVVVNQLGLGNFLVSMRKKPGFTEKDVLLSVTTVCFDISGLELYLPLISGGTTNMLSSQVTNDGIVLREIIENSDASVIQATPATWNILLMAGWGEKLPIKILCGGENLPLELADRLLKQCDELWNMYGPTETTIWSTIKQITDKNDINIGKPIDNTQVWIFDKNMNPVSGSQTGELYIGGYGVANGYYRREDLTKERFIDNPLQLGDRIYRTGDLVKKNGKDELVYLGRVDNQVKYHGFRIELEEIERVIQDKLNIEKAVAVIRKDELDEEALYAFIQTKEVMNQELIEQRLREFLPHYMIPSKYVNVNEFPLTANKKINRKYLVSLSINTIQENDAKGNKELNLEKDQDKLIQVVKDIDVSGLRKQKREQIRKVAAQIVKKLPEEIDTNKFMSSYGFNSIRYTVFCTKLNKELKCSITPALCYRYKTIDELANYLCNKEEVSESKTEAIPVLKDKMPWMEAVKEKKTTVESVKPIDIIQKNCKKSQIEGISESDIAIIGIGLHMPKADNGEEFWNILKDGKCVVGNIPDERWNVQEYKNYDKDYPDFGAFMNDIWSFDAAFFHLSPREADQMDPQQRIFLQSSWEAIEDAGYNPEKLAGSNTSVYVGTVESDYYNCLSKNIENADMFTISGNIQCGIANRVSYMLDLHGESETINTACSSSLVAIHHAVNALHRKECSMALAGGVNVILNPFMHYSLKKNGMLSPDGRCKSFDAEANGYVRGEGCGVILLKPAIQAYQEGDHIYALIKGTGVNHDGCTNSFTAPNPLMQTRLIAKVYEDNNIRPDYLSYIETHGTGTKLGDPIEINALKDAFYSLYQDMHISKKFQYCAIGSVKTNIGHLEAAAGIAGVLKVILAMSRKTITKVAGLKEVNPFIEIADSPFYIPNENQEWEGIVDEEGRKRWIAGVSSFGFGGTNAHIVLEAYTETQGEYKKTSTAKYLFPLSNETKAGLLSYVKKMKIYLEKEQQTDNGDDQLEQIAYTLQNGRKPCEQRVAFVASDMKEFLGKIDAFLKENQKENISVSEKDNSQLLKELFYDEDGNEYLKYLLAKHSLEKIARLWVLGLEIDWSILGTNTYKKANLPTYEFKKMEHRFNKPDLCQDEVKQVVGEKTYEVFPVSLKDPYVKEHVIDGKCIFPGIKYLELGAQSGLKSTSGPICLKQNEWIAAKSVLEDDTFYVAVEDGQDQVSYKVWSRAGERKVLHAKGKLEKSLQLDRSKEVDINKIYSRCSNSISREHIYSKYAELGYSYGKLYQPVESIAYSDQEFLSSIILTDDMKENTSDTRFQVSLFEGGMQAVIASFFVYNEKMKFMPVGIRQCSIYSNLDVKHAYGYAKLVQTTVKEREIVKEFDISILDESGSILIELFGYVLCAQRIYRGEKPDINEISLIRSSYREETLDVSGIEELASSKLLVLQNGKLEFQSLIQSLKEKFVCNILNNTKDMDTYVLQSEIKKANIILILDNTQEEEETYSTLLRIAKECILERYKGKVVYLYKNRPGESICYQSAALGFARCYQNETMNTSMTVIEVDDGNHYHLQIIHELLHGTQNFIKYENGSRKLLTFERVSIGQKSELIKDKAGCYLITGGTGHIGLSLAEEILKRYPDSKLVLLARSGFSNNLTDYLKIQENSSVEVIQADIADFEQTNQAISQILDKYGGVKGIFHAAGNIEDAYIREKDLEKAKSVISPKIQGILNIDSALKNESLDFIVLFSSVSAVLGNAGQSDYCYANSFMDVFSVWRNQLMNQGRRSGNTISVNWGIWEKGSMKLNESELQSLRKRTGILPISTTQGLDLLLSLGNILGCICAVRVENDKLLERLNFVQQEFSAIVIKSEAKVVQRTITTKDVRKSIAAILRECCSKVIHIAVNDILLDRELGGYGFDSLTNTELANEVNEQLGVDITPVTFFEYTTLDALISFLMEEYESTLQEKFTSNESEDSIVVQSDAVEAAIEEQSVGFEMLTRIPYAKAHTVFEQPVILGVTYVSHFAECLEALDWDISSGSFKNILFHQAVAITKENTLSYQVKAVQKKEVLSLTEQWKSPEGDVVVATGTFQTGVYEEEFKESLHEGMLDAAREVDREFIYHYKWCYDVKYEKELHSVEKVWIRDDIVEGCIHLKEEVKGLYHVNPAILDGAMICGLYAFLENVKESYIPYMIRSISIKDTIPDTCYCICKKKQLTDEFLFMDIKIVHPSGKILCYMKDFICKKVDAVERFTSTSNQNTKNAMEHKENDVAIIGMSASFAGSESAEEYWKCLIEQQDIIREIPEDHFDYKPFYDPNSNGHDKMYTKWGGFIEDVDKFDASFFHISRREAEVMDPQLRLLLEHTYHAAEDAGYGNSIKGSNTGMYVGNCFHDYQQKMDRKQMKVSSHDLTGNALTMLANRPSYCFDLKGPSVNVDTACSSSLVALHMACRALQHNECEMAFVGGVNILLESWHYRYFCRIGALSKSGRCHTFTDEADGYIPGDGVAVVLLKPLKKAIEDHDSIYGVIKGSAINHGGMTSSITVPSLAQETKVVENAWKEAGIHGEDISYIEAHGTGTKLGDPIEINALKHVFEKSKEKNQTCYIGSAKASIGHTEGAAGLAGVIKVLLSMKYHTIPAMPFFKNMNPYINLKDSNIRINRESVEWKPKNGKMIAGVSSFGAGGAYAHVVIEEYKQPLLSAAKPESRLIVLSAKGESSLRDACRNMKNAIQKIIANSQNDENAMLRAISYTLLTGREPMNVRIAFVAKNLHGIVQKIHFFLEGNMEKVHFQSLDDEINKNEKEMDQNIEIEEIAKLWVEGCNISKSIIDTLFGEVHEHISLPGYAFDKKSYWIEPIQKSRDNWISKENFFIENHKIHDSYVMPAVAYFDYVIKAAKEKGQKINRMSHINFMNPLQIADCPKELKVDIKNDGCFLIQSKSEEGKQTHVQGCINSAKNIEEDFDSYEQYNDLTYEMSSMKFYKELDNYGLHIGKKFQSVQKLQYDVNRVKAEICISAELAETFDYFILHPAVLDGVLQSIISRNNDEALHIPFEIEEMYLLRKMEKHVIVYGKRNKLNGKWDVTVVDQEEKVLLVIVGIVSKEVSSINHVSKEENDDWLVKTLIQLKNDEITISDVDRMLEAMKGEL